MAWEPLGWAPQWYSEIARFPRAVLSARFPTVPLHGDFTQLDVAALPPVDVLIGGTPCQAFSTTGLRRSLADARGQLTLGYVKLAHDLAATGSLRYAVWENVPGVLRTKDNAFGCFLSGLVGADEPLRGPRERGWWPNAGLVSGPLGRAGWRVLDAQFLDVPQRRERVFVVFCAAAAGRDPAEVLFDRAGTGGALRPSKVAAFDRALAASDGVPDMGFNAYQGYASHVAGAALAGDGPKIDVGVIQSDGRMRRYTPVERERLQGFPDGWTDIPWPVTETQRDNLRVEAVGNSMAVPVIRWLGERIEAHERDLATNVAA